MSRVRSRSNQRGARSEWHSLAVVVGSIYLGLIGGFLAASKLE
jgi:hypothetical protein